MKALLITNGYFLNRNNAYKIQWFEEEFHTRGVETQMIDAITLLPLLSGNRIDIPALGSFDFAINLDKDRYLAKILDGKLPVFNSYESLVLSDDKIQSIIALQKSGIVSPLTIPAPLCYIDSPDEKDVKRFLDQVESALSYPLVYKAAHGSLGAEVALVRNRRELEETEKAHRGIEHLYEKFLAKHQGHDYRIIVVGSKAVAAMERINLKDFRSNIALGGVGRDVTNTLSADYLDMAVRSCQILKLDYAGIDIGTDDDDKPCFIEANGNAFFTEIEKVSGINVTALVADHILKKILK